MECRAFEIAKEKCDEFVKKGKTFTLEELRQEIISSGGVPYTSEGNSIKMYLDGAYVYKDILYFDEYAEIYGFVSDLKKVEEKLEKELEEENFYN